MSRICDICGKTVNAGMTTDEGDFYVHDGKCFKKFMNKLYGKNQWMRIGTNNDFGDGRGGYYIATDDTELAGYKGTGIYYTDWVDDKEEKESPINLMVEDTNETITVLAGFNPPLICKSCKYRERGYDEYPCIRCKHKMADCYEKEGEVL